jgi:hypothetical protein
MYAVDTADPADLANFGSAARDGRAAAALRRRQLSQGKEALNGNGAAPIAVNGAGNGVAPLPVVENLQGNGAAPAARAGAAAASNAVAAAQFGRAISMQRRRQLSQGKEALNGNGAAPAESRYRNGAAPQPVASVGTPAPPARTVEASDAVAAAQFGRAISMQRRRQLSQGKQALTGGLAPMGAAASASAQSAVESRPVEATPSGRDQARARRAEASRLGGAGISRPQRQGQIAYPPKVVVSPTHGAQYVTGLRIGPGERVTGDEPGAALPVTGTQYVAADGSPPAMGAGPKVGHVRTPHGLVVSGTLVRNKIPITGDEFGEHLRITGEADQKFDDDLTSRRDGSYRAVQFPRRADPQGATALGTRLGRPGMIPSAGDTVWKPLETTDGGLPVTGTGVGRSGRVTGNEAGSCRPISGDQYQNYASSECGAIGGGTAPGAHLNRARLDPVTGGKVTVLQTWRGQPVTGPNVEHSPSVTGDEPGSCRPVTGTPYQGPFTAFGWCEPDEGAFAAQRLDPRPQGVAVTGDIPMTSDAVTGTERGEQRDVTGTPYYRDLRPAEAAGDDWARYQAFPVALARRLAGPASGDGTAQQNRQGAPVSCVPGSITGSFAVGEGMVTGNNEFLFRPRPNGGSGPPAVTGEGRTEGREITGSPAAWKSHDRVTGTEGYIAARRNPSEGGGGFNAWAGTRRFKNLATHGEPGDGARVTGRVGGTPKDAARVTVSGGATG